MEEISLLRSEKQELEGESDKLYVSLPLPLPHLTQQFTSYNQLRRYAWDEPFYRPRVVSKHYVDPSSVREYFTVDSVLSGVRTLFERVFKVKMKEVGVENDESWCRPRVRKFAFYDGDSSEPL